MDIKYIKMAIAEATKGINNGHGGPFGCVIVKDGVVIAKGHNQVIKNHNATQHGEMVAISKASKVLKTHDLSGCELYTTGEPCPMCLCAIMWANIDKVYYGCTIEDNDKIGFRDNIFNEKLTINRQNFADMMTQLGREDCLKLFEQYNNIKDKQQY